MSGLKEIVWLGNSREMLKDFPKTARQEMGWELDSLQQGEEPTDFKPIKMEGAGVYEIRIRTTDDAFRAFYIAKFEEAIYVIHAFQKKTQRTAKVDIDIGKKRYKELLKERKNL